MLIVLAQRRVLYSLDGHEADDPATGAKSVAKGVDVVILDRHEVRSSDADEVLFERDLVQQGFTITSDDLGIVVFSRGP